jgi:Na+/melibiose symporter-like transporter
LIFDSDPELIFRPILSALRGAMITLIAFITFFMTSGVDRLQHAQAYVGAIVLAFALHYVNAWITARGMRRRYYEKKRGLTNKDGPISLKE